MGFMIVNKAIYRKIEGLIMKLAFCAPLPSLPHPSFPFHLPNVHKRFPFRVLLLRSVQPGDGCLCQCDASFTRPTWTGSGFLRNPWVYEVVL
jgi:hypothetical protein